MKNAILLGIIKATQSAFPSFAASVFSRMWFGVTKTEPHKDLDHYKKLCQEIEFEHRGEKHKAFLKTNSQSQKLIVFIHGWSGRWDQFLEMAGEFNRRGYNVLTFDLPAHGQNQGLTSDVFEFAELLVNLGKTISLNDSIVVCHSAGFLAWSLYFKSVPSNVVQKMILISCPGEFSYLIDTFVRRFHFNERFVAALWEIVGKRGRTSVPKQVLALEHMTRVPDEKVLIVHDENDRVVGFQESLKLKALWPDAILIKTQKLGHNRILKNEKVMSNILDFIND